LLIGRPPPMSRLLPYTTLFRSLTIVVSPLISLMKDQVDALRDAGAPAALINSTIPRDEADATLAAARKGELKLLYVAPERFDTRSEEHTSELQSRENLVCRLLL